MAKKREDKHDHCWHQTGKVVAVYVQYSGDAYHVIEQCCECWQFRRENRYPMQVEPT